ncbi:unnamed protein product [Rhodiola kirilowii]
MAAVRAQQVSISIDDDEIRNNVEDDEVTSRPRKASYFVNPGFRVEREGPEFEVVERSFLSGLALFNGNRANVVDVQRCCDSQSVISRARMDAFWIYAEAVARKRGGDANVKQAWYGGSREEIRDIVAHGFTGFKAAPPQSVVLGRGVYLSAAKRAVDAMKEADEDEDGMRHVLMCRVILGNQEEIRPGSQQCFPSSMEFDTGVNCLSEPRKYIVWSAYMNVYILPSYIVSFKIDPVAQGLSGRSLGGRMIRPTSAWVKFSKLVSLLGKVLSPSQMAQIIKSYKDFSERRIDRQQMILKLRLIAGDKLLAATIKQSRERV